MRQTLVAYVRRLLADCDSISFEQLDALIIVLRSDAQLLRIASRGNTAVAIKYREGESLTENERHRLLNRGIRLVRSVAIRDWRKRDLFALNLNAKSISHVRK